MMKRSALFVAVAIALLGLAYPASADPVGSPGNPFGQLQVKENNVTPGVGVRVYGGIAGTGGLNTTAGIYVLGTGAPSTSPWTFPATFNSFCIDLSEYSNTAFTTYDVINVQYAPRPNALYGSPMGDTKANYIRELWGRHRVDVVDNTTAAAFQAAVWEIVYENIQSWDVGAWNATLDINGQTQSFKIDGPTGSGTVITTANTWLSSLTKDTTKYENNLIALSSREYQDFVGKVDGPPPSSIPVPGAMILGAIGLGLVGWMKRRLA